MEYLESLVQNMPVLERAGILDNDKRIRHFLAQCAAETGGFTIKEENGNYSAQGLLDTFPKYFKSKSMARAYAHKPEAIFNRTYGGRMGNTLPGDGYKYRGRGILQMTGKESYQRFGDMLGIDLVNNPDLASDPMISVKAAVQYWTDKGLNAWADKDDLLAVSRGVNVGNPKKNIQPNGMKHRKSWYAKLSKALTFGAAAAPAQAPEGLTEGDEGTNVKSLQSRLRAKGYPVGAIDGIAGANTRRAIVLFQDEHKTANRDGVWRPEYDTLLDTSPGINEERRDVTASDMRAQGDKPVIQLTWTRRILTSLGLAGLAYGQTADQIPQIPHVVSQYQPVFEALSPLAQFLANNGPLLMCVGMLLAAWILGSVIKRLVTAYRHFDYQGQFKREGE